jgi:hypothetical protein
MPQIIHTLAEHDSLRPRPVSRTLAQAVQTLPMAQDESAGRLQEAIPDGNGRVWVKGWARLPESDRPADCVVLGLDTAAGWQPQWVMEPGGKPSEVVAEPGSFFRPLIARPPAADGAVIRACAVDLQRERAYPLAGAIKIAP